MIILLQIKKTGELKHDTCIIDETFMIIELIHC
jgi:hypothetical protein